MMEPNDTRFEYEKFLSPDVRHAPVYIWVWNAPCTKELIDAQLSEMERLGIRAFYIIAEPKSFRPASMPTFLEPDYLTEEFWELCAYALEGGKKRGMNCWVYDEGGWPSGGACGRVLADRPEYAKSALAVREISFSAGETYAPTDENVFAAFDPSDMMIAPGHFFDRSAAVTEYYCAKHNGGGSDYPDLMNGDATEYFIKLTHEGYAFALEDFSDTVSAVFTDEPKAPNRPLNGELVQRYEAEYGESVLPHLPLIAGKRAVTEENAHILRRWFDLCSRVFCENFMLPCKAWANAHGVAFTGHMDRDHDPLGAIHGGGHFHLMRALRCMDLPGIDVIWRQIYPKELTGVRDDVNCVNGFFPRYAASAARQTGSEFAMSESFGVLGPGINYGIMRYILGFQAVRGINVFNFFNFPLGRSGQLLAQELPVFSGDQLYCGELGLFNAYVERLAYIASLGRRKCCTALYYPVNDFWDGLNAETVAEEYDALGRALEDRFVDFDIADDDVLTSGAVKYENIVVPQCARLPEKTKQLLEKHVLEGGRVFHSASEPESEVTVESENCVIRVCRRELESGELMMLFCEEGSGKFRVAVPSEKVFKLSLETGEVSSLPILSGFAELSGEPGQTAVLLLGIDGLSAEPERKVQGEHELSSAFTLKKERQVVCGDKGFGTVLCSGEPVSADLGGWESVFGKEFSGSGVYETEFELCSDLCNRVFGLELGKVCFTARVELNGTELGTVIAAPYRFEIPSGLLKTKNRLKMTVTNTDANWYANTDYFDRWTESELSGYFAGEKEYARDYADGGLWGPVKLIY